MGYDLEAVSPDAGENTRHLCLNMWAMAELRHLLYTMGVWESGRVDEYKFTSNNGWHVTPEECRFLADACDHWLNTNVRSLGVRPDRAWRNIVERFKALCEANAELEGLRVW